MSFFLCVCLHLFFFVVFFNDGGLFHRIQYGDDGGRNQTTLFVVIENDIDAIDFLFLISFFLGPLPFICCRRFWPRRMWQNGRQKEKKKKKKETSSAT